MSPPSPPAQFSQHQIRCYGKGAIGSSSMFQKGWENILGSGQKVEENLKLNKASLVMGGGTLCTLVSRFHIVARILEQC